jgi:hypothetical protein
MKEAASVPPVVMESLRKSALHPVVSVVTEQTLESSLSQDLLLVDTVAVVDVVLAAAATVAEEEEGVAHEVMPHIERS